MGVFNNLKLSSKLLVAFGAVFAISTTASVISYASSGAVEEATRWNTHTYKVLAAAQAAGAAMVDQETGVRGFLIAGDEDFLQPYESGVQRYETSVAELKSLTADNAEQQQRISKLQDLAHSWREKVAEVEIRQMKDPATVEAARTMEASGAGKEAMDGIRTS